MLSKSPTFISMFSGAGGLDIGLEQAGWDCLYASDLDVAAVATIEANRGFKIARGRRAFAHTVIEQSDIRGASAEQILSQIGARRGDVPLLAGGPPCQSWSSAGHQRGFDDPRGRLFDDFIKVANGLDTRWLVLENVRGLLTARGPDGIPGSALSQIRQKLLAAGFQTSVSLLNAADFGVPQRRVRLFLLGFRIGDPPPFPVATHGKSGATSNPGHPAWVTMQDALHGIAPLTSDEIIRPTGKLAGELSTIPAGKGVISAGKAERTRPGGHWGYKQGAFVADTTQSARTVTANAQQDWIRDPVWGLRRLTPRECAAIQTFPDGWSFVGPTAAQYRLVGNAVPPLLGRAIGTSLKKHLKRAPTDEAAVAELLPLPAKLRSAIDYTQREERSNGASRRAIPARRNARTERVDGAARDGA